MMVDDDAVYDLLVMAETLVSLRWERLGTGDWQVGDPTGWRRRFCLLSAVVYAAHFLRLPDPVRHRAMRLLEEMTVEDRTRGVKDPKDARSLSWWNAQQPNGEAVARLLREARDRLLWRG